MIQAVADTDDDQTDNAAESTTAQEADDPVTTAQEGTAGPETEMELAPERTVIRQPGTRLTKDAENQRTARIAQQREEAALNAETPAPVHQPAQAHEPEPKRYTGPSWLKDLTLSADISPAYAVHQEALMTLRAPHFEGQSLPERQLQPLASL